MKKEKCRVFVNVFTAVMPFAAWFMMLGGASGVLSSHGWESLKYFTVLSNLLEGLASVCWLAVVCMHRPGGRHRAEVLKFIASLCVFLTFATVMLFLGPMFGYGGMFKGANFWFHLIIPLTAVLEMLFLVREQISVRETACSVVPVALYGSFYLGNILMNGVKDENGWNDFYGFVTWGIPAGVLIFAGICLVVFCTGLGLRKLIGRK